MYKRQVVYEVKDDRRKTYSSKDFKSLINDKVMAGLSAFVTADGTFTDDGVRRAASVLKGHAKRARYFDCKRIDVFATAVLRNAANSAEAVACLLYTSKRSYFTKRRFQRSYFFFISSMKPLAMNTTMIRTMMATITQIAHMGICIPKSSTMVATPLSKHAEACGSIPII